MNSTENNWTSLFSITAPYNSPTGKFTSGQKLFVGLLETSPGWYRVHVRDVAGNRVNRMLNGPWRKPTAIKHARNTFASQRIS